MHPTDWGGFYTSYPTSFVLVPIQATFNEAPLCERKAQSHVGLRESAYGPLTESSLLIPSGRPPSPSSPVLAPPTSTSHGTNAQVQKSKRIFVARIPSNVSESELRKYFERYGIIEDAYRPRDFSKNTFRGIGFVTFQDPCVVETVIASKHVLGGAEVVVDRATPKESKDVTSEEESRMPSETLVNNYASIELHGSYNEQTFDLNFLGCLPTPGTYPNSNGNNHGPPSNISDDWEVSIGPGENLEANAKTLLGMTKRHVPEAAGKLIRNGSGTPRTKGERNQRMSDNSPHVRKVRKGPRIFVGKISKDTIEQDLSDYFSQFGFVMDVYIPRSKENKREHRGFGFVTFETEASIKRAISQGTHLLKGAVLAIDVAVPEDSSN